MRQFPTPWLPSVAARRHTDIGCGWCKMASDLVIASVTAVLKHLLENGLAGRSLAATIGSEATVSALSPDRVPVGELERPRLNLCLFMVTPYTSLPRGDGRSSVSNLRTVGTPLLLDLHYLISAYGSEDLQSEVLLGFALRLLHDHPVLGREQIRLALEAQSSSEIGRSVAPAFAALSASTLLDSVERVRIQPEFPSLDELSRLWLALQARFRPSAAYKVSAVVIDS